MIDSNTLNLMMHSDDLIKIFTSLIVGGLIGLEREYRTKSAGLRTFTLICLGSTIFTIISEKVGHFSSPDRIAANIVTGIGFLGAGVIFKTDDRVSGLTTATIIWVTAALGMSIGDGHIILSFLGVFTILTVLITFIYLEKWMNKRRENKHYVLVYSRNADDDCLHEKLAKAHQLRLNRGKITINSQTICHSFNLRGKTTNQQKFIKALMALPDIERFEAT